MKPRIRTRMQLHLDDGQTVEGVLLNRRGGYYTLADVGVEVPGESRFLRPEGVGDTHIPRGRVRFITEVAS